MKTRLISILMVFFLATLACSTLSVPSATATETVAPTATKTEVPTITPEPTKTDTPTPEVNECESLENKSFVYNDNFILADFSALDQKAMSHFPGGGEIVLEGLAEDAEKIRDVYMQVSALETPPYFSAYHKLELGFLKAYVTALDAALKGDKGTTFTYLDEAQRIYLLLSTEILRLNDACPPVNSSQSA